MRRNRRFELSHLLTVVVALAACATLAGASGSADIVARNGHTASMVFDEADVQALSEWDTDELWFGGFAVSNDDAPHTVAGDEDGAIYVLVHGGTPTDEDTWVTGVVRYDASSTPSLETVHQRAFTVDLDGYQAMVRVELEDGVENALLSTGDLLLLENELVNGQFTFRVVAVTAAGLVEIVPTGSLFGYSSAGDLAIGTDGTIFVRDGSGIHRLDYDAVDDEYDAPDLVLDKSSYTWEVGPDGDVYVLLKEYNDNGNLTKNIVRADPYGYNDYEDFWAKASYPLPDGFTFHTDGKLYVGTYKKNKDRGFLSKRNNRGKFPYKKRLADWHWGWEMHVDTIKSSPDDTFLFVVRTAESGDSIYEEDHSVWRIE